MKKVIYLGLLTTFLFGCGVNSSSSNSISSLDPTSSSEVSSSLGPVSYELEEEMLDALGEGYRVDGLYSATVKNQVVSAFYYEYNCTSNVYEYTSYADNPSDPSKDKVEDSYRYEGFDYGDGTLYLTLAKINLANEVVNYPVTDGYGSLLTWSSTGFANAFEKLKPSHFEKTENEFEFELKMGVLSMRSIYAALTSQFSSYMGLTAASFFLTTDGHKITGYKMTYQPLTTISGSMYITVEGTFTASGSEVVQPLQTFDGESNEFFEIMFEELRNHTYRVDVDLGVKSYKMIVENAEGFVYDEYDDAGKKISSYGFYYIRDGVLQGVTKINDELYNDGPAGTGSLLNILPTLNISSELFVLVEEKDGKSVFKYNEDAPDINEIGYSYDYGIFGGSKIGELTITISEDEVVIQNKLKFNTETFRYYNINGIKRYFDNVNKNCDNLKWSDIISNQEEEAQKVYDVIPKEALDLIPTVGGINARIDVDATYKPDEPVFAVPLYVDGASLFTSYELKLIDSGYEYNEDLSVDGKSAFTKSCVVNGETRTLVVKIYLAQDYLSGSQFLIYPSII